ncbi:MAG TPA: hypothetical protein VMW10_10300 [Alphaproteobacteria bacterium]|nr:hypothetical protein [Alphaproteobacteria bacterium]
MKVLLSTTMALAVVTVLGAGQAANATITGQIDSGYSQGQIILVHGGGHHHGGHSWHRGHRGHGWHGWGHRHHHGWWGGGGNCWWTRWGLQCW